MKLTVSGPQKLQGEVVVSGAKNSSTRVLAGALLTDEKVVLRSFPTKLNDAVNKIGFIKELGAEVEINDEENQVTLSSQGLSSENIVNFDLPIRTTYLLAAATLVREGKAKVPYPGGCKIGSRGYDLHIMVWKSLGCEVTEKQEYIEVVGNLKAGKVDFPISTVGGTENAILCASVAEGETLISNAYVTPEVEDLIAFLREMGAVIELEGSSHIRIKGANGLLGGTSYSIMPDRIEALTWIVLAAVTNSTLLIKNVNLKDLEIPLIHLQHAGINVLTDNIGTILVSPDCIGKHGIQPFELACGTHPGVISDMQPFYVFLALFANGRSVIYDYRYPERIKYAEELDKFSPGSITAEKGKITVVGKANLKAANTVSPDLRGSMALAMAALCAEGESNIEEIDMALRGYNDLASKLKKLGVKANWS
ncbi:MAG: UDP-N-acetylglucosamine 1-carboxyvinyltransferase [Thiopseudomonas sp.]